MYRTAEDLLRSFALSTSIEERIAHLSSVVSQLDPAIQETQIGQLMMGRVEKLLDDASTYLETLTGR